MFSPDSLSPPKRIPPRSKSTVAGQPKSFSVAFPPVWCTYILICIDGSYYVGLTNDLAQRIHDHSSGKGPTYTKLTKPKLLTWFEFHQDRAPAVRRERQLKAWSRTKKNALARDALQLGPAAQNVRLPLD